MNKVGFAAILLIAAFAFGFAGRVLQSPASSRMLPTLAPTLRPAPTPIEQAAPYSIESMHDLEASYEAFKEEGNLMIEAFTAIFRLDMECRYHYVHKYFVDIFNEIFIYSCVPSLQRS